MRLIDADEIPYTDLSEGRGVCWVTFRDWIKEMPTADVRKNVHAKKVIGGGERDGATCWFECSHCHGTVDILDAYCKHYGAVLELENDL